MNKYPVMVIETNRSFQDIATALDACAAEGAGCDSCPVFEGCQELWDKCVDANIDDGGVGGDIRPAKLVFFERQFKALQKLKEDKGSGLTL